MDYLDYDEDLVGEAPCEFCGDLFPLCLLIEHETTHLNEDHQFFLDDADLSEVVMKEKTTTEPKKVEENKQMQNSVRELKEVIPVQTSETSNQKSDSKKSNLQTVKNYTIPAQPLKASRTTVETKKSHHKNYHSGIEEFTTDKGEKLLVYGADIDPMENVESEKQSYKKPNNPLLSTITKEEDVIDINSLSDDDSSESLEEFWKRARDFLKRNRGKI